MTDAGSSLPRLGRVTRKADYDRVFREGAKAWDGWVTVWVARGEDASSVRLGTAVSRRIGNAVRRNRVRRRLKAAFREVGRELGGGWDLVVVPASRQRTVDPPFAILCDSLRAVVARAQAKLARRRPRDAR